MIKSAIAKKGTSRLFKGVQICPPIAPKTILSPNLNGQKVARDSSKSGQKRSNSKRFKENDEPSESRSSPV